MDTFNRMRDEDAQLTKEAQETPQEEVNEEMELIHKYASWADETLLSEHGKGNYSEEDVEKLAEAKMEADAEELYQREKVAEAYEMGQIMYQGFKAAASEDAE